MPDLSPWEMESRPVALGENFFLSGNDAWLKDLVIQGIKDKIRQSVGAELVLAYGDEIRAAQLNDLLDAYSIFSSAKLILLRNAECLNKTELECLAAYFEAPSDQQSLVIMAEDKIDGRISAWRKIKAGCVNVVCDPPRYSGDMVSWLDKRLRQMGKTMTRQARELFINRVELDYADANNELQKLGILTGERQQITDADVSQSVGTSRTGTISDFYRALGRKQLKEALDLMERMLSSDWAGLQIMFQINKFFMVITHILLMKKHHLSNTEIVSKNLMELFPGQRQEFVTLSANFSLPQTDRIFRILLETDALIKTSMGSDSVLLTVCVVKILESA